VFVVSPVTWVEMDTAEPLKSEIGEGRRRLLFREAVAAISLGFSSLPLSYLSLFTCLPYHTLLKQGSTSKGPGRRNLIN
jgi:hypothetical protein